MLYSNIDFLRLKITNPFTYKKINQLFSGLSENSNVKTFKFKNVEFTATFFKATKQKTVCFLNYESVPILEFVKLDSDLIKMDYISFYSSFFRFPDIEFLLDLIIKHKNSFVVSRLDFAIDVESTVRNLVGTFNSKKLTYSKIDTKLGKIETIANKKTGNIETVYVGDRLKTKEYFVRIYNKILDTQVKGKHLIYDYSKYAAVTRVEVVFKSRQLALYNISAIDCHNFIKGKKNPILSFVNTHLSNNKTTNIKYLDLKSNKLQKVVSNNLKKAVFTSDLQLINKYLKVVSKLEERNLDVQKIYNERSQYTEYVYSQNLLELFL
jgi:hypothetical protein